MAASLALLDEVYSAPSHSPPDPNHYNYGRIGLHNIVLVCLPAGVTGTASAATVAAQFRTTFRSIQYGLLVGVGGGAPSTTSDIRLGDVVVSKPTDIFGGVVQYDFGKTIEKGVFKLTASLNKPPRVLLSALASLETKCHLEGNQLTSDSLAIPDAYSELRSAAKYPGAEYDQLYEAKCCHGNDPEACERCDTPRLVDRPPRHHEDPVIHFGLIASANQVMRHGGTREKLRKELNVLCFEMEAAGLMDLFPCLVIRGVCDYADVHKTKKWQPYAAATAAACAKQILLLTPVVLEKKLNVALNDTAPSTAWSTASIGCCFRNIRNQRFSGRDTELALLDSWYSGSDHLAQGQNTQTRIVIHGLGGVGKTQLVTEWCHRLHQQYHVCIFWAPAGSWEELMTKYQQHARQIRKFARTFESAKRLVEAHDLDGDDTALVKAWIQTYQLWVIVLDNYDTISVDIEPFLPDGIGHIVITSRDRRAIGTVSNRGFELKRPQAAEAELLFLRLSCPQNDITPENITEHPEYTIVKEIVSDLDGFPLAISQAAAYVRENEPFSCAEYLEILRVRSDREFLLRFKEERPEYPESVMTTWEISLAYLRKKHPEAAELLQLLGFFARSGVAEAILQDPTGIKPWRVGSCVKTRQLNSKQREELSFLQSRARAAMSLGILISLSLVSKNSDKIVSVHPLVHEWIQARLKPNPAESKRFLCLCSLILYQAYPLERITSGHTSQFTDVLTFTPHLTGMLDTLLQQAKQDLGPMPLEFRALILAHLLFETRRTFGYMRAIRVPPFIRVSPSGISTTKEPLDIIQSQLFDGLRDLPSLSHVMAVLRVMKVLQLRLPTGRSAPLWTPPGKVYLVALVTFSVEMFEHWRLRFDTPSSRSASNNPRIDELCSETKQHTALALCNILSYLSLEKGKKSDEIFFLRVRIKLVLAHVITIDEYLKLPQLFFRDRISWQQVACVDLSTALEYCAACATFSTPYPKDLEGVLLFAVDAFSHSEESKSLTGSVSVPFMSNSFGRDIESYIPRLLTQPMIQASKVLGNACLECGLTLLKDLESKTTISTTDERITGNSLLGVLRAWDKVQSVVNGRAETTQIDISGTRNTSLFTYDNQRFNFKRLYVHAHFLSTDYSDAMIGLEELFQAKKVMARFQTEYSNPRRLLLRENDGGRSEHTATLSPLLSHLFRLFREELQQDQHPRPNINGP